MQSSVCGGQLEEGFRVESVDHLEVFGAGMKDKCGCEFERGNLQRNCISIIPNV